MGGLGSSINSSSGTNMEWEMRVEDLENDESYSDTLTCILPRVQDGE